MRASFIAADTRDAEADPRGAAGALPARQLLIMTATMTFLMGIILSGIFTYLERGLFKDFLRVWFERFWATYLIVLPTVALVGPLARKIAAMVERRFFAPVQTPSDQQ